MAKTVKGAIVHELTKPLATLPSITRSRNRSQRCSRPSRLSSGLTGCVSQSTGAYDGAMTVTIENDVFTSSDNNYTDGIGVSWVSNELGTYDEDRFVQQVGQILVLPARHRGSGLPHVCVVVHRPGDACTDRHLEPRSAAGRPTLFRRSVLGQPALRAQRALDACMESQSRRRRPCVAGREFSEEVPRMDGFGGAHGLGHANAERGDPQRGLCVRAPVGRGEVSANRRNGGSFLWAAPVSAITSPASGAVSTGRSAGTWWRLSAAPLCAQDSMWRRPSASGQWTGWSVSFSGGLGGNAIVHYLPLDGTVFHDSRSVDSEPFVGLATSAFTVRHRGLTLSFTKTFFTDLYKTEAQNTDYGTFNVSWLF